MTFILTAEDKKRLYLLKAHLDSVQNKEPDLIEICSNLEKIYLEDLDSFPVDTNTKTATEYINKYIRTPLIKLYSIPHLVPEAAEVTEKIFETLIGLAIYWPLNDRDKKGIPICYIVLEPIEKAEDRAVLVSGHQYDRASLQEWFTKSSKSPTDILPVSEREIFFNFPSELSKSNEIISAKLKSEKVALQRKYERDPKESRKERIVMVLAAVLFAAAFVTTAIFCPPIAAALTLNYIVCFGFMGTIVSGIAGFLTSHCHTMRKGDKEFSALVNEERCRIEAKYATTKKSNEFLGKLHVADTSVQNNVLKKKNTKIHSSAAAKITESREEKTLDNNPITSESSLNNVSHAVIAPSVENTDLAIKKLLSKEELREKRAQYFNNKNLNKENSATPPVTEPVKISVVIQPVAHKETNWSSSLFSCKNDVMNADVVNNNQEICAVSLVS